LEAAKHFVRLGANKVILGCRSLDRGFNAKKSILHSFAADPQIIDVWEVDVGNWESVRKFCKRIEGLARVDVIVENAGVATPTFELVEGTGVQGIEGCEKGFESTITINVIGTFLMALLVLPKLSESAAKFNITPRLTIVASDAHEQVPMCSPILPLAILCTFC
jgi:retinol dehydrogenase-12